MEKDSGVPVGVLRTDGGMVGNELLMQFQADILDRTVVRPAVKETTALGAAYAAGLATGFYASVEDLRAQWSVDHTWKPQMDAERRERMYGFWKKAVTRAVDWLGAERHTVVVGEFLGTMVLILLGNGVVANVLLKKSKAEGAGWMVIATGWALGVMARSEEHTSELQSLRHLVC